MCVCVCLYSVRENKWEVEMNEKTTKHYSGEHIRCHWPIENRKWVNENTFQAPLAYICIYMKRSYESNWIATSDDEKNKLSARTKSRGLRSTNVRPRSSAHNAHIFTHLIHLPYKIWIPILWIYYGYFMPVDNKAIQSIFRPFNYKSRMLKANSKYS